MPETAVKPARKRPRISRLHQPPDMSLQDWQIELRREFAREQPFELENLGRNEVFSEFAVTNPAGGRTYRVVIRGESPGENYCCCPDYAVNTLGTCKHVEFTLHQLRRQSPAALKKGYHPPFAEVFVRYGTQRQVIFSPGAGCPKALETLARRHFGEDGLRPESFDTFDTFVRQAAAIGHELRIYDDAKALVAEVRDAAARRELLRRRYASGNARAWKGLLKIPLYPYQREGALFADPAGGAIIADELGLGKPAQALAGAEILAGECGADGVLIVCPASLKYQWKQEIERFSARPATVIEGLTHQRRQLYGQDGFFKVVNYDVLHRDLAAIAAWGPDLVILDEAQRIKNWQTRAAKTVKRLESPYALVLTGTPLENRLEELHSIMEFVDRHRLGPLFAFKATHEVREEDSARVVGYRELDKISRTLAPILIRRNKAQVLNQLPPRMDKNFFVSMTEPQWVPHRENQETVARLAAKWRRYKFLTEADQIRLRIALQYMRMACDNTYLIDHRTKHGTKVQELEKLLGEIFERPGQKAVIFSQWLRMNELVAQMLEDRGWGHVHLHGGVPSKERKELTRALREEPDCRVFLSTDAGGVGLNLQAASTVINLDLPWNPAVLEQRIGRVHRMGQSQPVRVVNYISEGTIEHGMLSLLAFKRSMFAGVLDGAAHEVSMGEGALSRFMRTVETAISSTPQVSPTPTEEASSPGAKVEASAEQAPEPSDAEALTQLLARGAELLTSLGRALGGGPGDGGEHASSPSLARIERRPESGRRELRIALPDDQVLQRWVIQLSELARAVTRPS